MSFKDWLMYSNVIMGLGAASVSFTSSIVLERIPSFSLLFSVFLVGFGAYILNRFAEMNEEDNISHPRRARFFAERKGLIIVAIVAIFASVFITFSYADYITTLFLLFAPIGVILYSFKFIPKYYKIKKIFLIKNAFPAFVWSLLVLFTAFWLKTPWKETVFVFAFFVFLRFLVGCISFDVRDVKGDKKYGINSFPVVFGINKTKRFLHLINVFSGIYLIIAIQLGFLPKVAYLLSIVCIYGYFFISWLSEESSTFLFDIVIDGEYILWSVLSLMGLLLIGY